MVERVKSTNGLFMPSVVILGTGNAVRTAVRTALSVIQSIPHFQLQSLAEQVVCNPLTPSRQVRGRFEDHDYG
jgi:hypothetical protein